MKSEMEKRRDYKAQLYELWVAENTPIPNLSADQYRAIEYARGKIPPLSWKAIHTWWVHSAFPRLTVSGLKSRYYKERKRRNG